MNKPIESASTPSTLIEIESSAFTNCRRLNKAIIAEGVKIIGFRCFAGCTSLTLVTMPRRERIDETLFEDCGSFSFRFI